MGGRKVCKTYAKHNPKLPAKKTAKKKTPKKK